MSEVVILGGVRTPIGKFQGTLSHLRAPDLGAIAIREAIQRSGISPEQVGEVIMGNVLQAGIGHNPARQAALSAGVPDTVPPFTVSATPAPDPRRRGVSVPRWSLSKPRTSMGQTVIQMPHWMHEVLSPIRRRR